MAGFLACEVPSDAEVVAVGGAGPGGDFALERGQCGNSTPAEALSRYKTQLDFSLIEPTAVFGCVVDLQSAPERVAFDPAEMIRQRFPAMDIEIVHDEMNGSGKRVGRNDVTDYQGELEGGSIWSGAGKVSASFGFHDRKNIGRASTLVLVVAPRNVAGPHGADWPDVGMQRNRFLIQTDHRFRCRVGFFINGQDVFHLLDVFFVEVSHAPHFFPATA